MRSELEGHKASLGVECRRSAELASRFAKREVEVSRLSARLRDIEAKLAANRGLYGSRTSVVSGFIGGLTFTSKDRCAIKPAPVPTARLVFKRAEPLLTPDRNGRHCAPSRLGLRPTLLAA